jgi:RHS repeat-associated protein
MTAYTETIGTETSSASRTFNAANQLLVSLDNEAGTTSFYYVDNGNLVQILPPGVNPGEAGEQLYSFNQRNLLTEYRVGAGSSVYDTIAEYVYDGDGNRVQQVDYSGSTPVTTTYHNDNTGLSQVLVSDDGTTQTANLLGLSLIQQDDGSQTRTLLADGLGSVRVEMVGSAIDSATTYEPYGKLLARSGDSGTVYGYTGEQHDGATGLVYLRARYYNPVLRIFLSVDPWVGNSRRPMSYNKYLYVYANPVNLIDPTGLDAWWCDTPGCQAQHFGVDLNVLIFYLNGLGGAEEYPRIPNTANEYTYTLYALSLLAGEENVVHVPLFTEPYSAGRSHFQMFAEAWGTKKPETQFAADFIEQRLVDNPLKDGQRLVIVGSSAGGTVAIELLDFLQERSILVDQVVLRGSFVSKWSINNVCQVDYIAADPPWSDQWYSFDINPFDSVKVNQHRLHEFRGHTPQTPHQQRQIARLIVDLIIGRESSITSK